jgi:glycosyltransferase involved in cell wall biosynthesis
MKEVTIFCPTIGVGGVEKNLYILLNFLVKKKLKINLLTCSYDKKKKFNNKVKFIGPNNKKFCKSRQIIKIIICIFYFLRTNLIKKKTILFTFQSNIFMIILAYILDLKIIARINASPDFYLKNIFKKFFFSKIYRHANIIIVNSNDLKKKVQKFLKINPIVIYNPSYNKKKKLFLNSKKNFKKKNFINLLNVGRLVYQKNQILLIKTMKYLKFKTAIKFKLKIVGNGNLYKYLKKEILENKLSSEIKIIKNITNPSKYFKNSDYFILSSLYEGLPNVLIEAISFKNIVISSNCPTGPREILLNGKAGYLFKNNDHIHLAKILIKSLKNKKQNLKKVNLAFSLIKRFDEETNCRKYLSILNKFIYD